MKSEWLSGNMTAVESFTGAENAAFFGNFLHLLFGKLGPLLWPRKPLCDLEIPYWVQKVLGRIIQLK